MPIIEIEETVAELAVVDDLWYFIKKGGNWILGSG
ncbi:epipeptide YydF family RiPP [Boudabousia marimammalium]|nr:epipeptide YydF family RiPP [Boudabousia marimammalium]